MPPKRHDAGDAAEEALCEFERLWAELPRPAWARVRAEGLEHLKLGPLGSVKFAARYVRKWATLTFAHPPEVAAHFAASATALLRLAAADDAAAAGPAAPASRIALVGDMMWMRDHWASFPSEAAADLLRSRADGVVGNLETVLHETLPLDPLWLAQSWLPDMVTYSSPVAFLGAFRRGPSADGSAVSAAAPESSVLAAVATANNHSLDLGAKGAKATLRALAAAGIPSTGMRDASPSAADAAATSGEDAPAETWCSFERGGIKVGVYACTYGVNLADREGVGVTVQVLPGLAAAGALGGGISGIDFSEVAAALRGMRAAGCELCVAMPHWGHEFEGWPTPLQMRVARRLVALGADIVLGSHAHLQQPFEVLDVNGYGASPLPSAAEAAALRALPAACRLSGAEGPPRKALVAYCLGNFCTTMFNELCRVGLLAALHLRRHGGGNESGSGGNGNKGGGVTWTLAELHWLYNEAHVLVRPPFASRRLLLVRSDRLADMSAGPSADTPADTPGERGGGGSRRREERGRRGGGRGGGVRSPSPPPRAGRAGAGRAVAGREVAGEGGRWAAGWGRDAREISERRVSSPPRSFTSPFLPHPAHVLPSCLLSPDSADPFRPAPPHLPGFCLRRKRALVAFSRAHMLCMDPTLAAQAPPSPVYF